MVMSTAQLASCLSMNPKVISRMRQEKRFPIKEKNNRHENRLHAGHSSELFVGRRSSCITAADSGESASSA